MSLHSVAQKNNIDSSQKDSSTQIKKVLVEKRVVFDTQKVITYDTIRVVELAKSNEFAKKKTVKETVEQTVEETLESDKPDLSKIFSPGKIFWSIIVCLLAYILIRLLVIIVERFAERSTNHRITLKSISPIIRIIGWTLAAIIIIQGIFQPPMSTVIAAMASVGIAIGFASQDIIKNIFGGIMIIFDRPFQVGDKIEVGDYYGEVKEIGLRSTRIVTKDDSLVSLPNAEVVNKAVSNANAGEANCQVVAEIYLPLDINTDMVRQIAKEAAQVSRYIYLNKPIVVLFFNEVKDRRSFLKMRLKAYVSDIRNEFAFQSDMTEIVISELVKKGIIKKEELM
ncbi:MAG: mechanosensitive ion channel family protein [Bacteroidetes bacterium]|nr:MAG: mechanosensitive ion channel family protein [Bacteroidota bacterium]MBL1145575.1 mechanosensitive ion channel family protein [Bacteroidota bacterium]NOG58371.1 mechanosensitive ion channel [Bacteroidota bacterium]